MFLSEKNERERGKNIRNNYEKNRIACVFAY